MIKNVKNRKILIFIIIIIILFLLLKIFNIKEKIFKNIYPQNYQEYVEKYAEQYEVEPNLIFAIIKAESNFNINAKSNKNAKGLMQLMDETALEVAKKEGLEIKQEEIQNKLLEPEINIQLGTKYISTLIEKYQNIEIALTAYNAGIGTVDNWIEKGIIKQDGSDIENIPYKETNQYVRKILASYKIYNDLYCN